MDLSHVRQLSTRKSVAPTEVWYECEVCGFGAYTTRRNQRLCDACRQAMAQSVPKPVRVIGPMKLEDWNQLVARAQNGPDLPVYVRDLLPDYNDYNPLPVQRTCGD